MAVLFDPYFQAISADGIPFAGAKLYFYRAGTTSLVTVYSDAAGSTPRTNPVVASAAGLFPPIYLSTAVPLKYVLKDADGVTILTVDRFEPVGAGVTGNSYTVGQASDLPVPSNEYAEGIVLDDPDPSKNGYWYRIGGAWTFGRPFPDGFAKVGNWGGSANAQTAAVISGDTPTVVQMFFGVVEVENTGAMTLDVGTGAKAVVSAAGTSLSAGEWTGAVLFFLNDDGQYQLVNDAGAAAAAAQSAADAAASESAAAASEAAAAQSAADAEAAVASVNLPLIQPGDANKGLVVKADESGYGLSDITLDQGVVSWPPSSSDFAPFHVAVGGTSNPHMYFGYNTLPQAVLANPAERGAIFGIEAHYEPTPGTEWIEMYWQYNLDSGFTGDDCRRPIMAVIDKTTNVPVVLQLGGGTQGISLNLIDGTGTDQQKIVGKQKVEILPNRMTVVGNAGSTAPAFNVLSNPSSVTGIEIATGVAGYGGVVQVTSTATNEALYLRPKGSAPTVSQGTSFLIPNGSAANPSLSFESDQDTGFLRVSADVIGVAAGGQVRVSVSSVSGSSLNIEAPADGYSNLFFREAGATKWRFYNDFANDRLLVLDADASAGVYLDQNATSWASASDRRLPYKETGKTFSVLDKLDRFEILEFTRSGGALEIGVKAQDLHKAFPALVVPGADDEDRELSGMEDPGLWSIKADRAGFVALSGLKEMMEKFEDMAKELRLVKDEIARIKAQGAKR